MSDALYNKYKRASKSNPEFLEFAIDVAILHQKWTPPKIAKAMGITKQSFQTQINKEKEVNRGR